jgi:hypothetical protein
VTIQDTLLCALKLHQDSWSNITPEDVALHGRLIQQVYFAAAAAALFFFIIIIFYYYKHPHCSLYTIFCTRAIFDREYWHSSNTQNVFEKCLVQTSAGLWLT